MNAARIDPGFVVPDPTPANLFSFHEDPGPDGREAIFQEFADLAREQGMTQCRVTVTGPLSPDPTYQPVYPPGIWFEGWLDPRARQLEFGTGWPTLDNAIYPPLTAGPAAEDPA